MLKNIFCRTIWSVFAGICCLISNPPLECSSDIAFSDCCGFIHCPPNNIGLSHTEGKGLGYSLGYTSLDLFLAQAYCEGQIVPFVNLKGHAFNNGRFAANAGLGLRWSDASCSRVWGANFFYDSLNAKHLPYHQVSLGLEMLGEAWDVRVNGYLPVGHKRTNIYTLSYDFSNGFLAKAREQFAMGGIDAEIGYHFCKMQYLDLYAGIGPYYYRGRAPETENAFRSKHKEAFGGRLRALVDFLTYFELEGVTSYDSRFKWTGQVTLSVYIPFDWFCSFGDYLDDDVCAPCGLMSRLYQPVVRNEIIVVDRINRFSSNPLILDPEFEP